MLGRLMADPLLLSLMIEKYTKVEPQKESLLCLQSDLRRIVSPLKIRTLKHSAPALIESLHLTSDAETHLNIAVEHYHETKILTCQYTATT